MQESNALPAQTEKLVRGEFISVKEAVKKYRVGKDSFYNLIDDGTFSKFGHVKGKMHMDTAEIEEYIARNKVPAWKKPGGM